MREAVAFACVVGLFVSVGCTAPPQAVDIPPATEARPVAQTPIPGIVPWPRALERRDGQLPLSDLRAIYVSDTRDEDLRSLAGFAADIIRTGGGPALGIAAEQAGASGASGLRLVLTSGTSADAEGYALEITRSDLTITASTHAGLFYGLQTLRQILPATAPVTGDVSLPAVAIEDAPRFAYRGMHLDVGRHFFPVEFVKRYIDLMARYKLNRFHWHLTEDQGWRIEIRKYPRLTTIGSCRRETILEKNFVPYIGDGIPYCGFYTQDEIRDVVAYAAERHVMVIPEIEMPGHSVAALAAYPELACSEGPFEVATVWGVTEDIYCPSERTFAFLEDVLTEVMTLFPSPYIHIGGDEAPKKAWEESELAQEIIRREGLADEHELQSYFIRRIEKFLQAHGRRLIGWDEILEGGLAPNATVMSWRGTAGGVQAAREGHDVIMTPTSHAYFDYYQGDPEFEPLAIGGYTPLEQVYDFEPVPEALSIDEAAHVLGAQGNVWTEYMAKPAYVEYMVFPRLLALAEVVWSAKDRRNWQHFAARLPQQFQLLDAAGVQYRVPHVLGLENDRLTLADTVTVVLSVLTEGTEIRYTLDGSDPGTTASRYDGPLLLPVNATGVTVTARAFLPGGRVSTPRAATLRRTTLHAPAAIEAASLAPGLEYRYFEVEVLDVDSLIGRDPTAEGVAHEVKIVDHARDEWIGLIFDGLVRIDHGGVYTFHLTSDDGSTLRVADQLVVDHNGPHGPSTKRGMIALEAGYHPITVRFFQGGGGKALDLRMYREGGDPVNLTGRFAHQP